jgi:hypothetical protein
MINDKNIKEIYKNIIIDSLIEDIEKWIKLSECFYTFDSVCYANNMFFRISIPSILIPVYEIKIIKEHEVKLKFYSFMFINSELNKAIRKMIKKEKLRLKNILIEQHKKELEELYKNIPLSVERKTKIKNLFNI